MPMTAALEVVVLGGGLAVPQVAHDLLLDLERQYRDALKAPIHYCEAVH